MTDYFHLHFNKGEFNAEIYFIELKEILPYMVVAGILVNLLKR